MEIGSSLTMIGIIATIFSVAFALAALLVNARHSRQSREKTQLNLAGKDEDAGPAFSGENREAGRNGAREDVRSQALFKQFGPKGTKAAAEVHFEDNEYIWE